MLLVSSVIMALAWLGHLRFRSYGFFTAVFLSWCLVLPEYLLNIAAIRYGYGTFTGAQMASYNLCTGVVCVALVSRYVLGEELRMQQLVGFALMAVAIVLIVYKPSAG